MYHVLLLFKENCFKSEVKTRPLEYNVKFFYYIYIENLSLNASKIKLKKLYGIIMLCISKKKMIFSTF